MRRIAYLSALLALGLAACGGSDSGDDDNGTGGQGTQTSNGAATASSGMGTTTSSGNGGGTAGGQTNGMPDSGIIFGQEDGGKTMMGRDGSVVVAPPDSKVTCGQSECTAANGFICCDKGSDNTWAASSCVAESACGQSSFGPPKDAASECDAPSDCGLQQICCFVRKGPPGGTFEGTPTGRECMTLDDCNTMNFSGSIGRYACATDADCQAIQPSLKCAPEPADPAFTGKSGRAGRSWVKVCQ